MVNKGHLLESSFSIININKSQISFQLALIDSNYLISELINPDFTLIKKIIAQITHCIINV